MHFLIRNAAVGYNIHVAGKKQQRKAYFVRKLPQSGIVRKPANTDFCGAISAADTLKMKCDGSHDIPAKEESAGFVVRRITNNSIFRIAYIH